jgi:peptidyl-prolyl cis-trans isomerase SurA
MFSSAVIVRIVLGSVLAGTPAASAAGVDRLAAVVGSDVITWSEIYEAAGPQIEARLAEGVAPEARRAMEAEVLEMLIQRRLVEQEMRRLAIDVDDTDVERALGDIARQNGLERDGLQAAVEASGLAWDAYLSDLRSNIRDMKFNQQVLSPRITVRDDELRDSWRRHAAEWMGPAAIRLEGVLIPATDGAEAAMAEARRVAAEVGGGTRTLDAMGTFKPGELFQALDEVAFALPPGQISDPVVTPRGVFVLRVVERIEPTPPPFEEVEDRVRQAVLQEKLGLAREQWVVQARRRTGVKVLLEPVGDAAP